MSEFFVSRRQFLQHAPLAAIALPLLSNCKSGALAQQSDDILSLIRKNAITDASCNWCGAQAAPTSVAWKTVLARETDKGEPIIISGTIFEADAKTPAPDVLMYVYHTNAEGFYGRGNGEHPHGKHHGWMLTDEKGRYKFRTIKPAPYPMRDTPAHIHFTLTGRSFKEDWIDDIWFEGDRLITPEIRKKQLLGKGGFNPVLQLRKGTDGILRGTRDIKLWKA